MKIIDLLNKIAKGEMIGTKFEYENDYFMVGDSGQINRYTNESFKEIEYPYDNLGSDYDSLNDEVEIIEEEKEIRKLPNEIQHPRNFEEVVYIAEDLVRKINQIIDVINDMRDKE